VESKEVGDLKPLKEADLSGHLENGDGEEKSLNGKSSQKPEQSLAESDYQLNEALNLLKGLHIMRPARKS
jgi:carboxyl-terminal processing protease